MISFVCLQCPNGHLMCASCLAHLLADARLKDESATCPNCRCEINKTICSRNLAVEKAISELPAECQYCSQQLPRSSLEYHERQLCSERCVCIFCLSLSPEGTSAWSHCVTWSLEVTWLSWAKAFCGDYCFCVYFCSTFSLLFGSAVCFVSEEVLFHVSWITRCSFIFQLDRHVYFIDITMDYN